MGLTIETFSNVKGGNSFYKAISHPLAAPKAEALIARLAAAGAVAVYDPLGLFSGFAEFHDLSALEVSHAFVQDIAQIGEQTLAMDRWISKAGIVTVIGLVIVPVLLCGWAKVKMEYEGSKVASARFDHISDCEDLGSDQEEYDTCLLMVMNKSETEQAELAIVAERTRARQAKKSKVAEAE